MFWSHVEDAEVNVVKETKRAIEFLRSEGAKIVDIQLPHLKEIHLAHTITILTEMVLYMENHSNENLSQCNKLRQCSEKK